MHDLQAIRAKIHEARKEFMRVPTDESVKVVMDDLMDTIDKEFPDQTYATIEEMQLLCECMNLLYDYHFFKGDALGMMTTFSVIAETAIGTKESGRFTDEELKPILKIFLDCNTKRQRYAQTPYVERLYKDTFHTEDWKKCKCHLCRKNIADATGSHIVPHFLIQKFFSYDGSTKRDREIVTEVNMGKGTKREFIARGVSPEQWELLRPEGMSDEDFEIEALKDNPLMRDYYYCNECEKRFSVIESAYSDILNKKVKKYDPAIPYLFWMSVVWRMCDAYLAIGSRKRDREVMRKILNKALATDRNNIDTDINHIGGCGYHLVKLADTRDELLCIIGFHPLMKPYGAMIGNLAIVYFINKKYVEKGKEKMLNDGTAPEVMDEIGFLEFWTSKQNMIHTNYQQALDGEALEFPIYDLHKTIVVDEPVDLFEKENDGRMSFYNPNIFNEKGVNYYMNLPHSINKVMKVAQAIKEGKLSGSIEELTGYTMDEIDYMYNWWYSMTEQLLNNDE